MDTEKRRLFGVSTASLLPWSLGREGFRRSIEIAIKKAGFDGLQILPFRRWERFSIDRTMYKDRIISFGDAWNSGSLIGAIEREMYQFITRKKCAMEQKPLLLDWFLFGSQEKSEKIVQLFIKHFPHATYISNGWSKYIYERGYGAFELCPEMFPEKLRENIFNQIHVFSGINYIVWDTEHVLRPGRHGELPITTNSLNGNWLELLGKIVEEENIKLIHVKPHYQASELPQMLQALAKKTREVKCPVILEAKPIFKSKKKTIEWLKEHLDFLRMHFD